MTKVHEIEETGEYCFTCGQDAVTCQRCGERVCGSLSTWLDGEGNICRECFFTAHSPMLNLLKLLNDTIPKGEGAVSLNGSGGFNLEMWGALVASGDPKEIFVDRSLVIQNNPDWLPTVESIVARLNSILASN